MKKGEKKTIHALDCYIIYCFAFITIYTIIHTIIFAITGVEATTLTRLVFGVVGMEILLCFLIKRFKLHEEAKIVIGKKGSEIDSNDEYMGVE